MIGIVFGAVAEHETFFYVERFRVGYICCSWGFPAVEVLGVVLGDFFLELRWLLEETGFVLVGAPWISEDKIGRAHV